MTDYLTLAEVLAMHADLIARYGGSPGIRDLVFLKLPSSVPKPVTMKT